MNYRLPNPSDKKYRDNYDRTFDDDRIKYSDRDPLICDACSMQTDHIWVMSGKYLCRECRDSK